MFDAFRQGLRRFRQQPTFALTVLLVLTLGSGAVATVLAVADAVILRPLPYAAPGDLGVIWEVDAKHHNVIEVSHRNYADWRTQAKSFQDVAAMGSVNWSKRLTGHGEPADVPAGAVSASFFGVLGVPPELGQVLRESDDRRNAAPVVVIGHRFWQQRMGADSRAIGRTLTLDGKSFEIVGVMPQGFDFPKGAQLWIPVAPEIDAVSTELGVDPLESRWFGVLFVVGRLRPGLSWDHARVELDRINTQIDRVAGSRPPHAVVITPLEERLFGKTRPAVLLLLGAVLLIVMIACANVATLVLMRAARAQREAAIRISIGAAPRHLFRLWLAENLELFLPSGGAGLVVAQTMLPLVIRLAPDSVYRIGDARITMPIVFGVLTLMMLAAVTTTVLVTTLATLRLRLVETLRDSGSTATSVRLGSVRRLLVTAEVALACVLLIGAGLTIRSFMNLRTLDMGFNPESVLTLDVSPSREHNRDANRLFYAPLLERIKALPDVTEAGAVFLRPLAYEAIGTDTQALAEGHGVDDDSAWMHFALPVNRETATPGYFTAMRIPLRDGRYFSESDHESAGSVAIISESAANRLFPGQRAVGRRIAAGGEDPGPDGKLPWRTIVGVVSDVRYRGLQDIRYDYYLPYRQLPDGVKHLVIRTRGNPLRAIAQIRREVRHLDSLAVVEGVTTMEDLVGRAMAPWRLNMVLFVVLGLLALAIAMIGVYGVVQCAVVERWHELGIRVALGASARQRTRTIVIEGAVLALIGVSIGVAVALAAVRLMTTILFGVAPADRATFLAVAGVLAALAVAASYLPARLAGRADPASLLRSS
jgi:putative ABC transport system permease protein